MAEQLPGDSSLSAFCEQRSKLTPASTISKCPCVILEPLRSALFAFIFFKKISLFAFSWFNSIITQLVIDSSQGILKIKMQ
ncbi:MAG TPA: hypothetical protein DCE52_03730 [Rhodobacteraceae bacterium]|nr:hypothetical protein [Paracoccaceae bacterium]